MVNNNLAGWNFSTEEAIVFISGFIIAVIILIFGVFVIAREVIRGIKMYVKGTKSVRQGMIKRVGIVLLVIMMISILLNVTG